jgi:hypothetical protein
MFGLKRACIGAFALLVPFASHAQEAKRLWAPYNELYSLYEKYQALPQAQRDHLEFRLKATPKDSAIRRDQVQLAIVRKDGHVTIPISSEGVLEFPMSEQLHRENPTITTNLPAGKKLELEVEVLIKAPVREAYQYAELEKLLDHANSAVRSHAGMWAFFMPKAKGLEFRFADPAAASLRIRAKDGEKRLAANAQGRIVMPLEKKYLSENPVVALGARPDEIRPYFSTKMSLLVDSDAASK